MIQLIKEVRIMAQELNKHIIDSNEKLSDLTEQFLHGKPFVGAFVFDTEELRIQFFSDVGIDLSTFEEKYYYFNRDKNVHVAESSEGYIWISTMGLVARTRVTKNKFVNAIEGQTKVLQYLLHEAFILSKSDNSLDIDGYNYSQIEMLTPLIFHHAIFYYELLAKAYLSIYNQKFLPKHTLSYLLKLVKQTMYKYHHNNTFFHCQVIPSFEEIVRHISTIPGNFNEAYVKYDDNELDPTTVPFSPDNFESFLEIVRISSDIITDLYYDKDGSFYIKPHLYERLIAKCNSEEQREKIAEQYAFLLE